ncbi:alcohol dehydrogenase (cytochrome c)/outer membrane protein assembly factor BamB [Paenibacillus forsythiae]|uniref:Alcohol dehydrogenase (Cytochrome c)/outer membrane protein assembly factor BamB n=1 Tax=Paenibacillus forsythiae TaxID=365616 RepID=A0ABU3H1Q6_9BACL|nr:PQQ-binding-like beta-propeller repeat protein [Paenibacillus forsythiae]MDT3424748.1 alcohol dehydrogenase (cytochrome c)/outer membrane protein assembly factor BamB [Paenibacillus forsythiae]
MKKQTFILNTLLATALIAASDGLHGHIAAADTADRTPPVVSAAANSTVLVLKPLWRAQTNGIGLYDTKAPVSGNLVYYAASGKLIAADLSTGKVKWSIPGGQYPEVITNNSVFYITSSGNLVRADAQSGKITWKVKGVNPFSELGAHAELVNGTLIYFNEHGGLAAYNPANGKKKWENKSLPMYASSLVGQYDGVLIVSSTVDNYRKQFFGLDPATGRQRWRTEGAYSFLGYRNGQLIMRQQPDLSKVASSTAAPGYLVTLVQLSSRTGKVTRTENYTPLDNVSRLGNSFTATTGPYLYTADGNLDRNEAILRRYTLGQDSNAQPVSYEPYGNWLAGPNNGVAFFAKGTELIGVKTSSLDAISYGSFPSPVSRVQTAGKGIFASLDNGDLYLIEAATGKRLGCILTNVTEIGSVYTVKGTLLIQTNKGLFAAALPKSLK